MAAVISDINSMMPSLEVPKFEFQTNPNLASEFCKRLILMINDFNQNLDSGNEVGMKICNFGQQITIYIDDISYWNPSLIVFHGFHANTGNPVQLIQHVTQISILLIKLPKKNKEEAKRPIGFHSWEEFEESRK